MIDYSKIRPGDILTVNKVRHIPPTYHAAPGDQITVVDVGAAYIKGQNQRGEISEFAGPDGARQLTATGKNVPYGNRNACESAPGTDTTNRVSFLTLGDLTQWFDERHCPFAPEERKTWLQKPDNEQWYFVRLGFMNEVLVASQERHLSVVAEVLQRCASEADKLLKQIEDRDEEIKAHQDICAQYENRIDLKNEEIAGLAARLKRRAKSRRLAK